MSTTAKEQPDDTKEPSGASTRPAPKVVHLTEEERVGRGKSAREQTPRTSHAVLETDGRDPVAIVDADSASRVPELVPIRYGRMLVSAFTFYRGAASLMAHDLASTPRTGPQRPALRRCSLLELRRLRVTFARSRLRPERLRRDAARARSNGTSSASRRASRSPAGTGGSTTRSVARACSPSVRAYREGMRSFAAMGNLGVWYSRLDVTQLLGRARRPEAEAADQDRQAGRGEGADEGQHEGVRQADARGRRRAAHHLRPAADRADLTNWPATGTATRSRPS